MARSPMDPDRYQMRSIKRRLTSLEKALDRAEQKLKSLRHRAKLDGEALTLLLEWKEQIQSAPWPTPPPPPFQTSG